MKFLSMIAGVFSFCFISSANAVLITEVKSFNQIIDSNFHFIFADLADYGFVAGKDKVRDWVGDANITFEFRDPEYTPDKDPIDSPFVSVFMDQGRFYGRATNEDWERQAIFNQAGRLIPYIHPDEHIWLGDITLTFDLLQNRNVEVPEPLPLALLSIGLFAIGMRRYKITR